MLKSWHFVVALALVPTLAASAGERKKIKELPKKYEEFKLEYEMSTVNADESKTKVSNDHLLDAAATACFEDQLAELRRGLASEGGRAYSIYQDFFRVEKIKLVFVDNRAGKSLPKLKVEPERFEKSKTLVIHFAAKPQSGGCGLSSLVTSADLKKAAQADIERHGPEGGWVGDAFPPVVEKEKGKPDKKAQPRHHPAKKEKKSDENASKFH